MRIKISRVIEEVYEIDSDSDEAEMIRAIKRNEIPPAEGEQWLFDFWYANSTGDFLKDEMKATFYKGK